MPSLYVAALKIRGRAGGGFAKSWIETYLYTTGDDP